MTRQWHEATAVELAAAERGWFRVLARMSEKRGRRFGTNLSFAVFVLA